MADILHNYNVRLKSIFGEDQPEGCGIVHAFSDDEALQLAKLTYGNNRVIDVECADATDLELIAFSIHINNETITNEGYRSIQDHIELEDSFIDPMDIAKQERMDRHDEWDHKMHDGYYSI